MQKVGCEPLKEVSRYEKILYIDIYIAESIRFLLTLKESCDCNDKVPQF